jgi:ribosomal protein S18 acetylase RimI-like enzyme
MLHFEVIDTADHQFVGLARELMQEYSDEIDYDLERQGFAAEMASFPGRYAPPDGCFELVMFREQVAGCGGYRRYDDQTCELKRIYVRPDVRGMGFGKMLSEDLLRRALEHGYRRAVLDTLATMHAAQEMYQSLGFREMRREVSDYGPGIVYLERQLAPNKPAP